MLLLFGKETALLYSAYVFPPFLPPQVDGGPLKILALFLGFICGLKLLPTHSHITVIWQQFNGKNTEIQASELPSESHWSSPFSLSDNTFCASHAQIARNNLGDALAVWHRSDETTLRVQAAYCLKGDWEKAVTLSTTEVAAINPQVAINNQGTAIVLWEEATSPPSIQVALYDPQTGWSAPISLSDLNFSAKNPKIALNQKGDALAVWNAKNEAGEFFIQGSYYQEGFWSSPVFICNAPSKNPQVGHRLSWKWGDDRP